MGLGATNLQAGRIPRTRIACNGVACQQWKRLACVRRVSEVNFYPDAPPEIMRPVLSAIGQVGREEIRWHVVAAVSGVREVAIASAISRGTVDGERNSEPVM